MPTRGCYPGSFDPLTIAHLGIAEAALRQCGVEAIDLVLSEQALGKATAGRPSVAERAKTLREQLAARDRLHVATTPAQLLAEIADGYDWVVLGMDKWVQILEPEWYGSADARDVAIAALPRIALAPRAAPIATQAGPTDPARVERALPDGSIVLSIPVSLGEVSSTAARAGRTDWLAR